MWKQAWLTALAPLSFHTSRRAFATPLSIPCRSLHLKVGFTPGWLSFHAPQLLASPKPVWIHAEAKQAALGRKAAEPSLGVLLWAGGGSVGAELVPGGVDRSLVTTGLGEKCRLQTEHSQMPSLSPAHRNQAAHLSSHCQNKNGFHFQRNFVQQQ